MKCIGTAKTDGDLFSLTFSSEPPYRFGPGRIWNLSAPGHSTWGNLYTLQISFPSTSIQHAVYGGTCTYRLCIHCSCVWIRIHTGTEFSQFVDPYSECGSTFTQVKKKLMQKIEDNNSLFRIRNSTDKKCLPVPWLSYSFLKVFFSL